MLSGNTCHDPEHFHLQNSNNNNNKMFIFVSAHLEMLFPFFFLLSRLNVSIIANNFWNLLSIQQMHLKNEQQQTKKLNQI